MVFFVEWIVLLVKCRQISSINTFFIPPPPPRKAEWGIWKCQASVRPRFVASALRFLFVDQLISNLHTNIILGISSLSSKLGKTHKNFKVLQFQRKLIFRRLQPLQPLWWPFLQLFSIWSPKHIKHFEVLQCSNYKEN